MLTPPTTTAAMTCELEALAGDGGDVPEAGEEQEARQARQRAAERERQEHVALHRQARRAGRVGVRADRVQAPPVRQVAEHDLADEHDATSATPKTSRMSKSPIADEVRGREVDAASRGTRVVVTVRASAISISTTR